MHAVQVSLANKARIILPRENFLTKIRYLAFAANHFRANALELKLRSFELSNFERKNRKM